MKDKILKYIKKYKKENDYCPSYAEIAEALGCSRQNIHQHCASIDELDAYPEYRRLRNKRS